MCISTVMQIVMERWFKVDVNKIKKLFSIFKLYSFLDLQRNSFACDLCK